MEGESMITLQLEQGQCVDVMHMLSDYIMNMEDRIDCYGDDADMDEDKACLLYTSPSPRDGLLSRMPSSA